VSKSWSWSVYELFTVESQVVFTKGVSFPIIWHYKNRVVEGSTSRVVPLTNHFNYKWCVDARQDLGLGGYFLLWLSFFNLWVVVVRATMVLKWRK